MLPDAEASQEETPKQESETKLDVSEDTKTQEVQESEVKEDEPKKPEQTQPPKGYVPYADLKKERERRKKAESELETLQSSEPEVEPEPSPVEDSDLQRKVKELELDNKLSKHPDLDDKRDEVEEFIEDHPNYTLDDAIDLFKVRTGISDKPEPVGLESPNGGSKEVPTGYTAEEIEEMRKNDYRKYQKLLLAGKLDKVAL